MLANSVGIFKCQKEKTNPSFWKARLSSLVRNVKQNKEDKEGNECMCIHSNIKGMVAPSSTFPPPHFVLEPLSRSGRKGKPRCINS